MILAPDSITAEVDNTAKDIAGKAGEAAIKMKELSERVFEIEMENIKLDSEYLLMMEGLEKKVNDVAAECVSILSDKILSVDFILPLPAVVINRLVDISLGLVLFGVYITHP